MDTVDTDGAVAPDERSNPVDTNGKATATQPNEFERFCDELRSRRAGQAGLEAAQHNFKASAVRQYAPSALAAEAQRAIVTVAAAMKVEAEAKARVRAAKVDAEDARTLALLNATIDGKNDDARKAQQAKALREDANYQAALRQITDAEMAEAQAEVDVRAAQAQLDLHKALIRQGTAVLEFLAS